MQRRGLIVVLSVVAPAAVALAEVAACGLDPRGLGATASADATLEGTVEASSADAAHDAGPADVAADVSDAPIDTGPASCGNLLSCFGGCVTSCADCDGGGVLCSASRACAADCTACAPFGLGTTCYSCMGGPPSGYCASGPGGCPNDPPGGACACPGGDAGECPGSSQICTGGPGGVCRTCGQGGTDKKACANGLGCTASSGQCDRDQ